MCLYGDEILAVLQVDFVQNPEGATEPKTEEKGERQCVFTSVDMADDCLLTPNS